MIIDEEMSQTNGVHDQIKISQAAFDQVMKEGEELSQSWAELSKEERLAKKINMLQSIDNVFPEFRAIDPLWEEQDRSVTLARAGTVAKLIALRATIFSLVVEDRERA